MKIPIVALILCLATVINDPVHCQRIPDNDLEELASIMAGEFSSEEQSRQDSSYVHILLRMKPIWKERDDGHWFYVEQSLATAQKNPYRQRVYHLHLYDDTTVVSIVYEIRDPQRYIGGWEDETRLAGLSRDSLLNRQGCAVYLHKKERHVFEGSTRNKECLSNLRGATYATSEVAIYSDALISWDRGWDDHGNQVWGAGKGGYIFKKKRKLQ